MVMVCMITYIKRKKIKYELSKKSVPKGEEEGTFLRSSYYPLIFSLPSTTTSKRKRTIFPKKSLHHT